MVVLFSVMTGSYWPDSPPRNPQKYTNPSPHGQRSNGPAAPCWSSGVMCHFPNAAVEYPFPWSTRATLAEFFGQVALYPGQPPAISAIDPNPTAWWLRPDSKAARVGEQRAQTWKRL